MGFELRRPPFGPVQRGPNRIQLVEIENRLIVCPSSIKSWSSRLAPGLSVLVSIRIYRFQLHCEDLYMGVQVLCHPPNVGPPMNQRLCTANVLS